MLLGSGGAVMGVSLVGLAATPADAEPGTGRPSGGASVRSAIGFLQGVTDAYRTSGFRLAQSYYDESGLTDIGFVYDNALAILALLAGNDVTRARAIGDGLLHAQYHVEQDRDGRLSQAYHVLELVVPNDFRRTSVGDMAWAGIALVQLARRTRQGSYLTGALRIATWISALRSNSGLGGYTFGIWSGLEGHKSAEHNIDVYVFFRMIADLTSERVWNLRAQHAWDFVERLWNVEDGYFYTGSDDGSTVNTAPLQRPLDVQTWSWLAARQGRCAAALDWAKTNLATTDTPVRLNSALRGNYSVSGVAFGTGSLMADPTQPIDPWHGGPDSGAVWFEGNGQLALALTDRNRREDRSDAAELMAAIQSAQQHLGQGQTFNGKRIDGGIVAASSPLNTGFGFGYYQHLHVGATSWYVLAGTRTNPYRLGG
jgi:hypothetical protein